MVAKTGAAVRDLLIISHPLPQPVGQPPILIGQVEQPSARPWLVIAVGYLVKAIRLLAVACGPVAEPSRPPANNPRKFPQHYTSPLTGQTPKRKKVRI
jgi:hypothetical protein